MKKLLFVILIGFMAFNLIGQTETASYKDVSEKLAGYINQHQPDAIFNLYSIDMQTAMPLEKTSEFFTRLKPLGKITKIDFVKFKTDGAVYKTFFTQGILALHLSLDDNGKINGLYLGPYVPEDVPVIPRSRSKLILPFHKEWFVVWGGDTEALNYHVAENAQKNGFDFVMIDQAGKSCKNKGEKNEDYYCFSEKLIAPCAGQVVLAVDGIKDNNPGEMDQFFALGNTVIIKTPNNEYLFFCHFKQHSIVVKQGQQVKQGQLLGLCGNSGHSSEPHLHFHIQNIEELNIATGVKCHFDRIVVNGEKKTDYSPVKNEKIRNLPMKEL